MPFEPAARRVLRWRPGGLARDGARIFLGLGLRAAAQAALVLLLARWLGAAGYGAFVAALAVASFFTPVAGMGTAAVIVRDGSADRAHLFALRRQALRLWAITSVIGVGLAAVAMHWSLPAAVSPGALVALAVGEVAVGSLVELLARFEQAQHRALRFGLLMAGLPLARLLALAVLLLLATPLPAAWMTAYGVSSVLYAAALATVQSTSLRPATRQPTPPLVHLVREGAPFAAGALAARLQTEFNKPVLAHLSYADAGGFSVAQRLVDLVTLPLAALQEALWPRVFAADDPRSRIRRSGAALLGAALLGAVVLLVLAPLLPRVLGADYAPAAHALAALALLPALQLARNLGNAWMMSHGKSHALLAVYLVVAAVGVLLTLLWVPRYGLIGAVWAVYASEAAGVLSQASLGWLAGRRKR